MTEVVLFLFIHNLWYGSIFFLPQPLVWVSFYSSTTYGIGLFLFIHNLWYGSLFFLPQPLVWVSFYSFTISGIGIKETHTRGCG
jgi:hypothetical protein